MICRRTSVKAMIWAPLGPRAINRKGNDEKDVTCSNLNFFFFYRDVSQPHDGMARFGK